MDNLITARFEPRKDWTSSSASKKRFRERVWPALARAKRSAWRRHKMCGSAKAMNQSRLIEFTSRIAEARGWLPFVSLTDAHYMRVCDALADRLRYGKKR